MTLPELAIRRPVTTVVILLTIITIGLIALARLPLGFMPEMEERQVFVIVQYPNASPTSVERMIVRPLEEHLSSIEGLKHMWSSCDSDGGRVSLNFDWDADMGVVRAEVRERVDRAREDLPDDIEQIQLATNFNAQTTGETIIEGRIASGRDLSKNYALLDRKIIKPLERIDGVASVSLDGVNPREVRVNLNLEAMQRHQISAEQVRASLASNNEDRSLGMIRSDRQQFMLRAVGAFETVPQIAALPIAGTTLTLGDISEVSYIEPPLEYGRHLDGKFAVGVSVTQESNANTVEVCERVRERVAQMKDDPELEGIQFLVWDDQGREILKTIDDLKQTGWLGGLMSSLILFLFLRRFSTTLIAVCSIPFSLIVACGVIWAQGKTLNTISLLGLIVGIGMLVDNAVVVMENIDRYQRKGFAPKIAALLGSREVSIAVMASTLTSVIVFLPIFFSKPSQMNIVLGELALTISVTLLASLFISQTFIPLAVGHFSKVKSHGEGKLMARVEQAYKRQLVFFLRHRWMAPVLCLLVVVSAYYPFQHIDFNFNADKSELFVNIDYEFSEDLPLERKEAIITRVEQSLDPHKEKLNADSIYSWYSDRHSLTRLYMKEGFTSEDAMNATRKQLPALLPRIPGVQVKVSSAGGRFWERNSGKKVAFQLQGPESEVLSIYAEKAKEAFYKIDGLFDVYADTQSGASEVHARIDRERARALNVNLNQPGQTVELTFRGNRLPRFKDPDGEVEMRLTLGERETESLDQLKNLPLRNHQGELVPLESLATFAQVNGLSSINRENRVTSVWVGGRYEEGTKDVYQDKMKAVLEKMELPFGYKWEFGAGLQDEQESQQEFVVSLGLALLLIFAVMAALFESSVQALALVISLPFAMSGAVWTLYLFNVSFDQPAAIGLLLLLGIVVNNGIVMLDHVNSYRRKGVERHAAILGAAPNRLRPVLITAITTLVGLIPIIVQEPSLSGVYYYSMAYVIMGGLIISTILTMLLLPSIDTLLEDLVAFVLPKREVVLEPTSVQAETIPS